MEDLKAFISNNILAYIDLDPSTTSLNMCKSGLAHQPVGDDSARHTDIQLFCLKLSCGRILVLFHKLGSGCRPAELVGIRVLPRFPNLFKLLQPLLKLVLWLKFQISSSFLLLGK